MLRRLRKRLKPVSNVLLAVLLGMWVVTATSPCVMVMAMPDSMPDGAGSICDHGPGKPLLNTQTTCDALTSLDCRLPPAHAYTAADVPGDPVPAPVLLATLPVVSIVPDAASQRQHARNAAHISFPPLNLQHAVLLI